MPSNYGNWIAEGSGRDSYICVNNGGNQKVAGPVLGKGSPHFLKSTSERNFTFGASPVSGHAHSKVPEATNYAFRTYDKIATSRDPFGKPASPEVASVRRSQIQSDMRLSSPKFSVEAGRSTANARPLGKDTAPHGIGCGGHRGGSSYGEVFH